MDVRDKVIVVTGAADGIGKAMAQRFAAEGARALVLCDIDEARVRGVAEPLGALAMRVDVSQQPEIEALVAKSNADTSEQDDEGLSKKQLFLREKDARTDIRLNEQEPAELSNQKALVIRNVKTNESLMVPLDVKAVEKERDNFSHFVRCHFTNVQAKMDERLLTTLVQTAKRFHASIVEIVSGYRSPKYQLMLRKKNDAGRLM